MLEESIGGVVHGQEPFRAFTALQQLSGAACPPATPGPESIQELNLLSKICFRNTTLFILFYPNGRLGECYATPGGRGAIAYTMLVCQ